MKLTIEKWIGAGRRLGHGLEFELGLCLMGLALAGIANAQAFTTTTVQGTVYLANGQVGSGTLNVSWPAFTTTNGLAIAAGHTMVTIPPDGFLSVNLTPNVGATPAGLYYTAIYQMSDGTTSTQYWVVPAGAQASLGQVQAQLMPAAQAVQAVSKAYVDQSIAELTGSLLTASGGTLSGNLYLNGDPTQPLQAADKHYVDSASNMGIPMTGGNMTGPLGTPAVNGVQSPAVGSMQTTIQAAVSAAGTSGAVEIPPTYAGSDGFTNPNGVYVADLRQTKSQQFERSVKEFGAVCDGTTDDTSALQAALIYAENHGVALTIPEGTCKTHTLNWHGESIGGLGKQVSALMGFPGQDVLASSPDSVDLLSYTRLHDLTIYVDQSVDISCSAAVGRAAAGNCMVDRPLESNSIFSPGGNGLSGANGTGAAWMVGNCAIAMPALIGTGGNGLRVTEIENLEIVATGVDPMAQYPGAHSTHTCGLYLAQWPQWSEFRNIDIRGLNTGIAIPALVGAAPAGLNSDSNRWQNITIQATHGFTAAVGSNNVLDNVVAMVGNSAATSETPTGLVLDFAGTQQGWTVRNAVVLPAWSAVQPQLAVTASGGAVTGVTLGSEHGLGFDPYGTQAPLAFSGSCTALATASVNSTGAIGSIGSINVTQGGTGCSGTTTASVNVNGNWDTAAPVNLIAGQSMTFYGGNLLKGNGGYTVWNATASQSYGTQLDGGGGTLPGGGSYTALVANSKLGTTYQVDQYPGIDFGAKLQACLGSLSASYGGTCDGRNFTGTLSMGSNLTISTANATVLLPCATISTASQVIVTAGTRNVALRGCALRGASTASGSQGGTVFLYSGTGAMVQVGDPTYATDTNGFHMDNAVINTTAATSANAQGLVAYRTQELDIASLYLLGNSNQTGMTLDGTGNYTGGSFYGDQFSGFQTAVNAIGHQTVNPATTDWMNASTFIRLHVDCPTSGGYPTAGTIGINLRQGDGNTFTGGDVEGCSTALHLGANAQNNTIVGLRNENSTSQVVADAGSSYNNWMTGGTMFTGQLTDNGTRNSFLDTFHRSFNGMNGDWYGSQKDATVTNHLRLGTGTGNERGLLNEIQTDYGYRWLEGYSDATAGEQFYQVQDLLNGVNRLSIGQYNNGQSSTNNQTVLNSAGTGAVVLNGSTNSGIGGVVIGSGGASETTVATIDKSGDAQFNGTLQVSGTSTLIGTPTVKNQVDAEIDSILWAGLTQSQKESLIYKDWNGNSQWYMEKDASNNWELNSATGGLDSFKAYQSTNSGDTYLNASNVTGVVRVNYETGAGAGFNIYGGGSSNLYASFTGTTAIKFPGLAAGSGHDCMQIDNSGYITNTGAPCGSGNGNGTVSTGTSGQIAVYTASGNAVAGMNTVPVASGGTGASTATSALANMGGISSTTSAAQAIAGALTVAGNLAAQAVTAPTLGGARYAAQYQTGSGNNGIANAAASNQTVIADPSYGLTEQLSPYSSFPSLAPFHFQDDRASMSVDLYQNPGAGIMNTQSSWFYDSSFPARNTTCQFTVPSILNAGYFNHCEGINMNVYTPGFSYGNDAVGPQGWAIDIGLDANLLVYGSGITQAIGASQIKGGTGDNTTAYFYAYGQGGTISASDQGTNAVDGNTQETLNNYRGTCTTGCTAGATSILTTPVIAGAQALQGTGRYLIDTTQAPVSTTITGAGGGFGVSQITVASTSLPVSNAWGTLASNVTTPVNNTPSFSTSETFNVNIINGAFSCTSGSATYGTCPTTAPLAPLVCFVSQFHECAVPTAVGTPSGGVQSITIPLRRAHAAVSYVFQGGMAGNGLEITAYNVIGAGGQILRFLFDVFGSTAGNTIIAGEFHLSGVIPLPNVAGLLQFINLTSCSSTGTTVSCSYNYSGSTLYRPWSYNLGTYLIANSSDSVLNASCTNVLWNSAQTAFTCTIAGISGAHSTATATASLGLTGIELWPMAQVIDVREMNSSSPNYLSADGSFALEPNVIPFNSGDTVEEPHAVSAFYGVSQMQDSVENPYAGVAPLSVDCGGPGCEGGTASAGSNAMLNMQNAEPDSDYIGDGGIYSPLNGVSLSGGYQNGFLATEGPGALSGRFILIQNTLWQDQNPNYSYPIIEDDTNTGSMSMNWTPYTNALGIGTNGPMTLSAASLGLSGPVTANGANTFAGTNAINSPTITGTSTDSSTATYTGTKNFIGATVTLPPTGVGATSCTTCNLSIAADGRVTAASNGSGAGGYPTVVASGTQTALNGSTASFINYTPAVSGVYRVTVFVWVTAAGAAGCSLGTGAYVLPATGQAFGNGITQPCTSANVGVQATATGYWIAGANVTKQVTQTGTAGSLSYIASYVIERLM